MIGCEVVLQRVIGEEVVLQGVVGEVVLQRPDLSEGFGVSGGGETRPLRRLGVSGVGESRPLKGFWGRAE